MTFPSSRRTRILSSRSRATTRVSRSKNEASRSAPEGRTVRSVAGSFNRSFAKPLLDRMPAPFVDVQRFVGGLVHGLPVETLPPGGDADAELHGHGELGRAIEMLQRLADAEPDLAGVALVGVWHRHAELVPAEAATGVCRADGPLKLGGEHANRLIADVMPVRVVDLFQVVEVDHHQRQSALVPFRGRNRAVDRALELRAVGETGEVVGARLLGVLAGAVEGDRDLVRHRGDELQV